MAWCQPGAPFLLTRTAHGSKAYASERGRWTALGQRALAPRTACSALVGWVATCPCPNHRDRPTRRCPWSRLRRPRTSFCFAGCRTKGIATAIGLTLRIAPAPAPRRRGPRPGRLGPFLSTSKALWARSRISRSWCATVPQSRQTSGSVVFLRCFQEDPPLLLGLESLLAVISVFPIVSSPGFEPTPREGDSERGCIFRVDLRLEAC